MELSAFCASNARRSARRTPYDTLVTRLWCQNNDPLGNGPWYQNKIRISIYKCILAAELSKIGSAVFIMRLCNSLFYDFAIYFFVTLQFTCYSVIGIDWKRIFHLFGGSTFVATQLQHLVLYYYLIRNKQQTFLKNKYIH